jgi:membrane-associated phospholipid phosphatase
MHRPRYRLISATDEVTFHKWWQPFKGYKDLIEKHKALGDTEAQIKALKENCKSYPSGHSAEASILIVAATFFPMADKKLHQYQRSAFIIACACTALVMFARILAGAHYLSDVSWGASIVILLTFVANEVIMKIKPLKVEE